MNKGTLILIAALMLAGQSGFANEAEGKQTLTPDDKRELAWAIQILLESKSLKRTTDDQIQIKSSVLDELRAGGLLDVNGSRVSAICIDPNK